MKETAPTIESAEKAKTVPPVPEVFKLINSNAGEEAVVKQMYTDFYSPNTDREKTLVAFQALKDRQTTTALETLTKGDDELGSIAKKILQDPGALENLEKDLGIKRWGEIIRVESLEQILKHGYELARKKGFTTLTYREEAAKASRLVNSTTFNTHIDGGMDESIIPTGLTFGVVEPSYIEAVGAPEILRIREVEKPNFLLLGSLGKYSAQDFRKYSDKINPAIENHIVDISHGSLALIAKETIGPERHLVRGDARELPYASESMDHVYTNALFHFLGYEKDREISMEETRKGIFHILKETARLLKPDGSFIAYEVPYGDFKKDFSKARREMEAELISLAEEAGLILKKELPEDLWVLLTKDIGQALIDQNGFGQYKDIPIDTADRRPDVTMRFVKKS